MGNRFHKHEVTHMEELLEDDKVDVLDENLHRKLTKEFNSLPIRKGNKALQMSQVQRWFKKRKFLDTESTNSLNSSEKLDNSTDIHLPNKISSERSGDTLEKNSEQELDFEARSSTDHAWYDVAAFLKHRISSAGELEVKVRFRDFDSEEDEWVNVKKDMRERSIPLEAKECLKVEVGNLVLCFKERGDVAKYFDAHVLEIQRKLHDIRGCRCVFLVRYDHDQLEEKVNLRKICRRPTYKSTES